MGLSGSRAYGTSTPESDTDFKGVLVPPERFFWSPFQNFDQFEWKSADKSGRVSEQAGAEEAAVEGCIFSLPKFVQLAANCNPNVIELMFLRPQDYLVVSPAGEELLANRDLFLNKRAVYAFSGYAFSQLKRIKTHRKWLLDPPKAPPTRADYGLPEQPVFSGDEFGAADKLIQRNIRQMAPWLTEADNQHQEAFWEGVNNIVCLAQRYDSWLDIRNQAEDKLAQLIGFDTKFMEYYRLEKQYAEDAHKYSQYLSWLKNRNPARAELEARYGYDCKHAMHLVRLLRMGRELLTTGTLAVYRPDAAELLEIRNGLWAYPELEEWAEREIEAVNNLAKSPDCVVPAKPKTKEIEALCERLMEIQFRSLAG